MVEGSRVGRIPVMAFLVILLSGLLVILGVILYHICRDNYAEIETLRGQLGYAIARAERNYEDLVKARIEIQEGTKAMQVSRNYAMNLRKVLAKYQRLRVEIEDVLDEFECVE